ncbi:MAG: cytidine deaminase [Lachnospiraceae bacterium]|nr:cytidine deaminase [Lachnospiraceae bacterium]
MTELPAGIIDTLITKAHEMQQSSYCPYSGFAVGAALLTKEGRIYTGCNIENAAYSPSNCAERTAFFKAVSEGERSFRALAVVGGKNREIGELCFPCGVCRQVMSEFCSPDEFQVITRDSTGTTVIRTLRQLLPDSFEL